MTNVEFYVYFTISMAVFGIVGFVVTHKKEATTNKQ